MKAPVTIGTSLEAELLDVGMRADDMARWMAVGERLRLHAPEVHKQVTAEIMEYVAISNPTSQDDRRFIAQLESIAARLKAERVGGGA